MSLVHVPLVTDTRTCLWNIFHCWLTKGHEFGICSNADCTRTCIWYMFHCRLTHGNVSGTCSTVGWHVDMSEVHVQLLPDTWTCLWYMFHCWLTQGDVSGSCSTYDWHMVSGYMFYWCLTQGHVSGTCSTAVWHKYMSLDVFQCWLDPRHVPQHYLTYKIKTYHKNMSVYTKIMQNFAENFFEILRKFCDMQN